MRPILSMRPNVDFNGWLPRFQAWAGVAMLVRGRLCDAWGWIRRGAVGLELLGSMPLATAQLAVAYGSTPALDVALDREQSPRSTRPPNGVDIQSAWANIGSSSGEKMLTGRIYTAIAFAVLLLVVPTIATAGSGGSKLSRNLNKIRNYTEGSTRSCRKIAKSARKMWLGLRGKKLPSRYVKARSTIRGASRALPSICGQMGSIGADVRYYSRKVGADCLKCLGDGKCVSRRQIDKCQRNARTMNEKLRRFNRQSDKYRRHAKALRDAAKRFSRR